MRFPSSYAYINPCSSAGKISGDGYCHAAWRHQEATVCTSIVYGNITLDPTQPLMKNGWIMNLFLSGIGVALFWTDDQSVIFWSSQTTWLQVFVVVAKSTVLCITTLVTSWLFLVSLRTFDHLPHSNLKKYDIMYSDLFGTTKCHQSQCYRKLLPLAFVVFDECDLNIFVTYQLETVGSQETTR